MKITKIEQQKRNKDRFSLFIDDEFYMGIDQDVIIKHYLTKGMEVDEKFLNEIIKTEEQNKSNNTALNYISFKPRSEKEVRTKLKDKEFDEDIIDNTIAFLYKYNYLNDYDYGKSLINDKKNFKKAGTNLLKQELYKKGIAKDTIQELIEESYDYDEEYEMAYAVAIKKYNLIKNEDKNSIYRKLYSLLGRKGYGFDIINKVVKNIIDDKS